MNHYMKFLLAAAFARSSNAYFSMKCAGRIVRERLDPVVNPGKVAGHVHTISGGSGFSANMTYEDARASTCSSCPPKADLSNYWTPQLYVKLKDNSGFRPVPLIGDPQDRTGGMTIYYLQRPGGDNLTAFPPNFRMLAGDSAKRSPGTDFASQATSFHCLSGATESEPNSLPNYKCPGGLRAQVFFPACWNGRDLDSADHKSHMAYPTGEYNNGPCPASHPVHFVSIFYEVLYDVALFDAEWESESKQPFVFANGDATGYGFHGDFVNGWDTNILQSAIDTCVAHTDPDGTVRDGSIFDCKPLELFSDAEMAACTIPTIVDEKVDGKLAKLPGCNIPTYGPERAPPQNCGDNVGFGPGPNGNKDLSAIGWTYVGCGTDSVSDRAFKDGYMASSNLTVEACVDFCNAGGNSYAGLEYSRECFCAKSLRQGYVPGQGGAKCDMECGGEEGIWCGGSNALSIYKKDGGRKRGLRV